VPSPLSSTRLRRIIAAYTVNRLGTWFGLIALSVAVFDHTHSELAVAALFVAAQALPAFVVPALIARLETSTRRGELSRLYGYEAIATAALAGLLLWHFLLPALLLLVALDAIAALAASALLRAAAARCAHEWAQVEETDAQEAERRANAALNMGFAITFILGPALAGVVVAALGSPAALFIDVASFAVCGAMLLDLTPHVEDIETPSVGERVRAAWEHIQAVPTLRRVLFAEAVALVFFTFSPPIEVAYAKATLGAGDRGYGLLLGAWGLGVGIGSVLFARSIKRSLVLLLSASTLAVGLAYLGWAAAPSIEVACAAGLIGGIGNGVQWAALISAVPRLTPQRLHGQLMGAVESLGAICPAVGLTLGGIIAAADSPRGAFLVAGLGATLITVAFVRLPVGAIGQGGVALEGADGTRMASGVTSPVIEETDPERAIDPAASGAAPRRRHGLRESKGSAETGLSPR
jgi:MFS family permease